MPSPIRADISAAETVRSKESFAGSHHQRFLHNILLGKIEGARIALEACPADQDFRILQKELQMWREFMTLIHENDSKATREFYYAD